MRDLERKAEEKFRRAERKIRRAEQRIEDMGFAVDASMRDKLDAMAEGMMIEHVIEVKRTRIRSWPWRKLFHRIWCVIFKHRWTIVVGMDNPDYRMESCRRCGRIDEVDTTKTQPFELYDFSVVLSKEFARLRKSQLDQYKYGDAFSTITTFGRKRRVRSGV